MKGQRLNLPALQILTQIFKCPSLLLPHFHVQNITEINFNYLKKCGFKNVVFDKDNTITKPYSDNFWSTEIQEAITKRAMGTFGKGNVAIFSNTLGYVDNTIEFQGIKIIQHQKIQKPKGIEEVKSHFNNSNSKDILMVGDRYFTDIVFGNLNGMCTIYTEPFTNEGENNVVKLVSIQWLSASKFILTEQFI